MNMNNSHDLQLKEITRKDDFDNFLYFATGGWHFLARKEIIYPDEEVYNYVEKYLLFGKEYTINKNYKMRYA